MCIPSDGHARHSHVRDLWNYQLGVHEGKRRAPQNYFARSLGASPGDEASGLELYHRVASGNKNSCNIMVELTAKRRFQTYSSFWKRPEITKVETSLSGTYWDECVCMTLGQLAHCDGSKGHNRWGADPRHLTVVALWVNLNALLTGSFFEPM